MAITLNGRAVKIAHEGHQVRYEPLGEIARRYDGVLRSAVTTQRGYVRVHSFRTPDLDLADIALIEAELAGPGALTVSGDQVGSAVTCHPEGSYERTPAEDPREASLTFQLRESTTVAGDRKEHVRVMVADAADVLTDLTEWFVGATVTASLEQLAKTATVTFWRETATESVAPLMASPAPIDVGRRLWIDTAIVGLAETPDSADWTPLFRGTIDDVGWGGNASQVTVPCRDYAAQLHDTWIEEEAEYGSNVIPVAIETVMQALINSTDVSDTITTVGDPDFGIVLYEQQIQSLETGLTRHRDLIGWDLRYLFSDAQDDYVLTFYEPNTSAVTPTHFFGSTDYFEITGIERTSVGIRNKVKVKYSEELSVVALDSGSIAEFGTRFMFFDESKNAQINTEAAALALAEAALRDTSQPSLTHTASNALYPGIELGDLCRYAANDVHYEADQDVACVAYTHTLSAEGNSTAIEARGQPAGGVTRWYRKAEKAQRDQETEDVTDFEPELEAADIRFLYTTNESGVTSGFEVAGTAAESLGGWISTTEISTALNGIFRQVTDAERQAGITLHRSIAAVNSNRSPVPKVWEAVKVWLDSIGVSGDYVWAIGLDPTGIVDITANTIQSGVSPDEESPPDISPPINYVSPTAFDDLDVLDVGDVEAQEGFIVHIRMTVTAGAEGQITDENVVFRDSIPQEASS